MAENSADEIQEKIKKLRHELTLPVQSQFIRIDLEWALDQLEKLKHSDADFTEGWNSALDAVASELGHVFILSRLRGPNSVKFRQALARLHDPFNERRGSGY